MSKKLSLSALLSGLLAAPAIGAAPPAVQPVPGVPLVQTTPAAAFPVEMPVDVRRQLRKALAGKPLDAFGMQGLRRKIAADALRRVARIRAGEELIPVQLSAPVAQGAPVGAVQVAVEKEKAAFLGISTSPASVILRQQLNVPRGTGLVVDFVEKDSPAGSEEHGLKKYDVLEKFDDQLLVNPQQLAVLVRSKKPGDSATLTLLRDGKPLTVTVKLAEKEVPVLEDLGGVNLNAENPLALGNGLQLTPGPGVRSTVSLGADGSLVQRLADEQHVITLTTGNGKSRLVVKDREDNTLYDGPREGAQLPPEIMEKVRGMDQGTGMWRGNGAAPGLPGAGASTVSAINRKDAEHDITLRTDNGKRTLTVKDVKTGKTLYDGPADAAEELKALPAAVTEKIKALTAMAK